MVFLSWPGRLDVPKDQPFRPRSPAKRMDCEDVVKRKIAARLGRWFAPSQFRKIVDGIKDRLSFIPGLYVIGAVIFVHVTLWIDRSLSDRNLPEILVTTAESARAVFTAIAGGLISSITLLLSIVLIAVQLASSQFSPRTLRDWMGDRLLKHTIGIALGTSVFSLLALRSTTSLSQTGEVIVPHVTVIVAVAFGVIALFAVVGSVDHMSRNMRIGTVARRIATKTIAEIVKDGKRRDTDSARRHANSDGDDWNDSDDWTRPGDAVVIEASSSGWLQAVSTSDIIRLMPEGATARVVVPLGAFASRNTPLMWVSHVPAEAEAYEQQLRNAFTIGDSRTIEQDVAFGITQLADIAVRALSPAVNDPNTASDVIVHLGEILLALWELEDVAARTSENGRTLRRPRRRHVDYLQSAFDPIRRYGRTDPDVLATLLKTVHLVRSECVRRQLPGPRQPLDDMIDAVQTCADTSGWSAHERNQVDVLVLH